MVEVSNSKRNLTQGAVNDFRNSKLLKFVAHRAGLARSPYSLVLFASFLFAREHT